MRFNDHSRLAGQHAFLSASKYHWINYGDEKLEDMYLNAMTAQRGSELHAFAAEAIRLGIRLPGNGQTLSRYVNDAIGFKMTPEQTLFYSPNAFGTCDAIAFRRRKLRIHDLKNGVTITKETQLEVYAAFFCLEYEVKPATIEIELRIYQHDDVRIYEGEPDRITHIMDKIVQFDNRINELRREMLL